MIYALVEYVNKNGKIALKGFSSKEAVEEFIARLEKRKVEYLLTIL